jgi:hypothetical protein
VTKAYFLDSSALVKRYVTETGSAWVQAICRPDAGNTLIIARITWVEVLSALARLQREMALQPDRVATVIRSFRYDLDTQYQVVDLDRPLAEAAGQLVQQYPLRAYDAIQLATALKLHPALVRVIPSAYLFVSSDTRLLAVAQQVGLLTDDPANYT